MCTTWCTPPQHQPNTLACPLPPQHTTTHPRTHHYPPSPPTRVLFESGQQLAAVMAIRDLENRLLEGADHTAAQTLHALVDAAGAACRAQQTTTGGGVGSGVVEEVVQRPSWELCYCMPTVSASAFFMAAATSLDAAQPPQLVWGRGGLLCVCILCVYCVYAVL